MQNVKYDASEATIQGTPVNSVKTFQIKALSVKTGAVEETMPSVTD
jgi:hypothetical protein